jgi:glycosyltransferase involved in cell wall biosynthesis
MRIIFNAYNLVIGGGLSVGIGVVSSLYQLNSEDEIHVFVPRNKDYNFSSTERIKIHYLPTFFTQFLLGRFFVNLYLSYRVKKIKPDAIFSLGNYAIPSRYKQLLLLQWPYAVYPESIIWKRMSWLDFIRRKIRFFLFRINLKYATAVTVQTELMKERFLKFINYPIPIHVIESAHQFSNANLPNFSNDISRLKDAKLLLCMSEYYSHKNIEVLIPLAELIHKQKLPYKILLTLDDSSHRVARLLKEIDKKRLNGVIINLGRIEKQNIYSLYAASDALLLPTLLESFGIPYLEASFARLPIFTSDLDFAHDMNKEAAWYFDPLSAESILDTIESAFKNSTLLKEKTDKAFEKASKVRSWEQITIEYLQIIKSL